MKISSNNHKTEKYKTRQNKQIGSTQIKSDGQDSQTLQQLTLLIVIRLPDYCKSKNNVRTFQAENIGISKNSQLQIILLVLIKKECTARLHEIDFKATGYQLGIQQ